MHTFWKCVYISQIYLKYLYFQLTFLDLLIVPLALQTLHISIDVYNWSYLKNLFCLLNFPNRWVLSSMTWSSRPGINMSSLTHPSFLLTTFNKLLLILSLNVFWAYSSCSFLSTSFVCNLLSLPQPLFSPFYYLVLPFCRLSSILSPEGSHLQC